METAILEQRATISEDGTLLLHLPDGFRGQEVDVAVRPLIPSTKEELVVAINRPLSSVLRQRYNDLVTKRRLETLTPAEYEELQTLTDAVEGDHLRRWENIAHLAALERTDVMTIAARFGLTPAS